MDGQPHFSSQDEARYNPLSLKIVKKKELQRKNLGTAVARWISLVLN